MKMYKRVDFIQLPKGTIYSRVDVDSGELMSGLFCKMDEWEEPTDWVEQDLISEGGFPNGIIDGSDAFDYQMNLRDTFQEFKTDMHCSGRDGMYEESDLFVVWDKEDVQKLITFLTDICR